MDAKFEYAKVSCTVNIVFQMTTSTHAQFPILPDDSWVTEIIRICVGYVWTGKFDRETPGVDVVKRSGFPFFLF